MLGEKADELWDLYTKDREKTGQVHRRRDRMPQGRYHLTVHVCIFNSKNQLLVQQRQPFKKGWPNMWDFSAAGSAVAGESSCEAAEREVYEELGLKLDLSDVRPCFTVNFSTGFDDFYIIEQDVDLSMLHLQEEEVRKVRWVDKEETRKMQEQGIMVPYWFTDKLFEIRDSYDTQGERLHKMWVGTASLEHLESWMGMADMIRWDFPGLEAGETIQDYRDTVAKSMEQGHAVCALDCNMVVGILLFDVKPGTVSEYGISCMAVHPEYRRQKIATQMVRFMIGRAALGSKIFAWAFREDEEKGAAVRAFYQSLGFRPGELCIAKGYPAQMFLLEGCDRSFGLGGKV